MLAFLLVVSACVFLDLTPPTETGYGLNIGPHIGSQSRFTLATVGHCGADITVEGSNISRIQCSFEIHETTRAIMLQDRSSSQSTQTFGSTAERLELGRTPRRVLVTNQINRQFGFGGLNSKPVYV